MMPIRVGVICDFREEGWHSMDLVADMLLDTLPAVSSGTIAATRLQPAMGVSPGSPVDWFSNGIFVPLVPSGEKPVSALTR